MKKLLKIIGILVGVVVFLIVAAVIAVPIFVDPNDYKDQIAQAVEKQTGRKLRIDGDIRLSVFPWLGVKTGLVELGNASGFQGDYFARTEEMQVRVRLLPLLEKQVEMDTVRIDGLALNLARNKEGRTNWDDLVKAEPAGAPSTDAEKTDTPAIAALAVGGIRVNGANISWEDAIANQRVKVAQLEVETGPVSIGSPLELSIEFDVQSEQPALAGHIQASGEIALDAQTQMVQAKGLKVNAALKGAGLPGGALDVSLAADALLDQSKQTFSLTGLQVAIPNLDLGTMKGDVKVGGNIEGNLANGRYRGEGLAVEGSLAGEGIPGEKGLPFKLTTNLGLDLTEQTLVLQNYQLTSSDLSASGQVAVSKLLEAPAFGGDLKVAPFNLRQKLEQLGQSLPDMADKGALSKVQLETTFTGSASAISLKPLAVKLDDSTLKGSVGVSNFAKPAVRLDLAVDGLDVDRYLPPAAEAKPVSPATAAPAAGGLPVETLRGLDIDGQISIGKLKVTGLALDQVVVGLKAKDGLIKASPIRAGLFGGQYSGGVTLDATGEQAKIAMDEKLAGVRLGDLLKALKVDSGELDLSDAAGDVALRAQMTGDPAKQVYDIKGASVAANVTGKALPGGKLVAGASADLALDLGKRIVAGRNVNLSVQNLKLPNGISTTGQVDVANLDANLATQSYTAGGVAVDLKELKLTPEAKSAGVKLGVTKLTTNLANEQLNADNFTLDGLGVKANGKIAVTKFKSAPQVEGTLSIPSLNVKRMLQNLGQPPIETADPNALTSLGLDATFKASPDSISLEPFTLLLDPLADQSKPKLSGTLSVANFKAPQTRFNLEGTVINADRYLPPKAQGKAATPGAAAAALPLEMMRSLDADGTLKINTLILSGLQLNNIVVKVSAKDGLIKAQPVNASLYGGAYAGNINVDARGKAAQLTVDESLERVSMGPLLRDLTGGSERLSGNGNFRIQASATGATTDQLKQTLTGQTALALRDGAVKGIDLVNMLCSGLQSVGLFAGQAGGAETKFAEVTASATITNGVLDNRDFEAKSPLIRVGGAGTADLVQDRIDYLATAKLVGTCSGQGGLGIKDMSGFNIPVRITGSLGQPKVQPDYSAILKQGLTKGIAEEIQKKIGLPGLVLPGQPQPEAQPAPTGEAAAPQQPEQPAQQQQQQPPQKPEDALKELGKGLLKGLLK